MTNTKMSVTGDILTIEIDLAQRHGASGSGKSETVASTGGNQDLEGYPGIKVGVNVFKMLPKAPKASKK